MFIKRTSSNDKRTRKQQVAPSGCFTMNVGPGKQKFVMKTEFLNHPMFRILLEDAELEYGFSCEGPLHIPCEVNLFCKILAEMSSGQEWVPVGCVYGSFSPARCSIKSGMA